MLTSSLFDDVVNLGRSTEADHNQKAYDRYNSLYVNSDYIAAISPLGDHGVSWNVERANDLIDAALCICGHTLFTIDPTVEWTTYEQNFLINFLS